MRAWFAFIALSDHVSSGFGRFGMLTVLSLRPLSSQVKRIDLNGYGENILIQIDRTKEVRIYKNQLIS